MSVAESYLERYRNGDYQQVWTDLQALGPQVSEGALYEEAMAVARETMARARQNIGTIFERLQSLGYIFTWPERVFELPSASITAKIAELEQLVGPIPLSLRAWYESVGMVDFDGIHPILSPPDAIVSSEDEPTLPPRWVYSDPLVIYPIDRLLEEYEYRKLRLNLYDYGTMPPKTFPLDVSPGAIMKAGQAEGKPYHIRVPNPAADAPLEGEWHETTFVDYLRTCFRCGGFPGFDIEGFAQEYRDYIVQNLGEQPPPDLLSTLADGLLPI